MGRRRSKKPEARTPTSDADRLAKRIEPLARKLVALHEQARALGIFTNERELLACEACGLTEDVASEGLLFTHFEEDNRDTGMRFVETEAPGAFRCPSCGSVVVEPVDEQ
jgi:hypothetical protein